MNSLHINTPLFESQPLSVISEKRIWLKFESMQPSGSFKIRGMGHLCQEAVKQGAKSFVSSSGGNAGIAAAYAGRCLSIPVVVVVPESTSDRAKQLISEQNAEVIVHGESWQEANELAVTMSSDINILLHPFDNPLLWAGHASMVDEIVSTGEKPEAIVLSVGGGGLLCGVVEGLRRNNWGDVPIVAVETDGTNSLDQSVREGQLVELESVQGVATSLGARRVCDQAFKYANTYSIDNVVVSDKSAVDACIQFMDDHRVIVEPACGASLAVVYENMAQIDNFESVLVIVCGGVTATGPQLHQWATVIE